MGSDEFCTKYKTRMYLSEKGFCQFMKFIVEWDGADNILAQHVVAFRYYYRNKLFGTKFNGINIKKAQSMQDIGIHIGNRSHLEDIDKNFNFDNPCDCQSILHLTCMQLKMNDVKAEFCAHCTEILSDKELRQRKADFEETGDFEVERVIDYDTESNTYWVKWKNYPNAANCGTDLSLSFIDAVNDFWKQSEEKIPSQAQTDIDSLNLTKDEKSNDMSNGMEELDIACNKQPKVEQIASINVGKMEQQTPESSIDEDIEMKTESTVDFKLPNDKFIPVKLSDVMDKKYIIRRQKYTKQTCLRMKEKKKRYRKNGTAIAREFNR